MEVLLIGGGGREHALFWKLARSPLVTRIAVTHDNPGFPAHVERVSGDPVDYAARAGVDLVVVGPEAPLAEGIVDRLEERGIAAFGPTRTAARLESSKSFARAFMERHGIPGPRWTVHEEAASAHAAVSALGGSCVVKADGLCAGKGVVVAREAAEAHAAVDRIFQGEFGTAGQRVLVEERLDGPECSILALCDGERAVPLLPCRDHKRRFDFDRGPNTGGMGAVCPAPGVGQDVMDEVARTVFRPVLAGMASEGAPFRGVLYAGLMLTKAGPRVLEFNVRFGDPECQPLMMMLDQDLGPLALAAATGRLPDGPLQWKPGAACCVVVVAGDYPGTVRVGMPIRGVPSDETDLVCFYAGARREGSRVLVAGGRVLGVTARGADLEKARAKAYRAVERVQFDTASWRKDIGE